MEEDTDVYSTIRGDCDGCPEKYCTSRNHHELAWFLCRNPNKPKHPNLKRLERGMKNGRKKGRKSRSKN